MVDVPARSMSVINEEIRRMQATPAHAALLHKAAMEPTEPLSPAQMTEFVKTEYRRWGPAIQASGATVD